MTEYLSLRTVALENNLSFASTARYAGRRKEEGGRWKVEGGRWNGGRGRWFEGGNRQMVEPCCVH
jgi:hypothetical protein